MNAQTRNDNFNSGTDLFDLTTQTADNYWSQNNNTVHKQNAIQSSLSTFLLPPENANMPAQNSTNGFNEEDSIKLNHSKARNINQCQSSSSNVHKAPLTQNVELSSRTSANYSGRNASEDVNELNESNVSQSSSEFMVSLLTKASNFEQKAKVLCIIISLFQ